jgi:predicted HAD superfamily Cof-like phosphohydrolase
MNKSQYEQVRQFQKTFNLPAPDQPTILTDKQVMNRAAWIMEEVIELLHGSSNSETEFAHFYDILLDKMEDTYLRQVKKEYPEDKLVAQSDAFLDVLYFANGGFAELGVDPKELFNIVHRCNMSKIWDDGLPHYNEVGKVIKPPNWQPPENQLEAEIQRQVEVVK